MRIGVPLEQCWHDVPGGTARTAIDLTATLAARDDVEVIGVAARHREPPPAPWTPTVPVRHLGLPRKVLYETWHAARRPVVESVTGPIDLCHAVGGAIPGTKAPLVVTVHDLAFEHHPAMFSAQGRRFFRRALELTRREAVQVHVPSLATLEDCVVHGIERSRLRHVPWGCTVADVGDDAIARVRAAFDLPERWVVAVGTLEPRKNLPRLLDAWRRLQREDERLVLVGPAGWGDDVVEGGVPSGVVLTGFVDDETRDALLAGAALSCYPSLFEGFGLPVLESMALGCPVVTSVGTSTAELAGGDAGVLVDPLDVDAIAAGIASVLDDETLARRLIAAGRSRAAEYTWEHAAESTVRSYRQVVS